MWVYYISYGFKMYSGEDGCEQLSEFIFSDKKKKTNVKKLDSRLNVGVLFPCHSGSLKGQEELIWGVNYGEIHATGFL